MRAVNMKKNKLAMGLSLTILVALYGGGVAQAVQSNHSQNPAGVSDPIALQNPHNKGLPNEIKGGDQIPSHNQRQKMQFSVRKEAAKRLKKLHGQAREQHLQHEIENHGHGNERGNQ
jgi:hypothetical protein